MKYIKTITFCNECGHKIVKRELKKPRKRTLKDIEARKKWLAGKIAENEEVNRMENTEFNSSTTASGDAPRDELSQAPVDTPDAFEPVVRLVSEPTAPAWFKDHKRSCMGCATCQTIRQTWG